MTIDDDGRRRLHFQLSLFDDPVGRQSTFCAHCRRYYAASEEPDPLYRSRVGWSHGLLLRAR
jgi:hypothetical protein